MIESVSLADDVREFLAHTEFSGECGISRVSSDWSPRQFYRLTKSTHSAILLISPTDSSPNAVKGHLLSDFIRLNAHFRSLGLSVPEIYASDEKSGFLLIEDFDATPILNAEDQMGAFDGACGVLKVLKDHPNSLDVPLISYQDGHVYQALRYFPRYILEKPELEDEWMATWDTLMDELSALPQVLTHIDFFANNLMWLPEREGVKRIGILDYQGAVKGPYLYDLVNLLEDARRDIPEEIRQHCLSKMRSTIDPDLYDKAYAILTAQFHARVCGQMVFLAKEKGRTDLLALKDRLLPKVMLELQHPALKAVNQLV